MGTTAATNWNDRILAEIINEKLLMAPGLPRMTSSKHCTFDSSLIGSKASAKAFPRDGDLGPAADLAEGTAHSTATTYSLGTQLVLTPAPIGDYMLITYIALSKSLGVSIDELDSLLVNAPTVDAAANALAAVFAKQRFMILEGLEVKVMALLDDFTDELEDTGVDITLLNVATAIFRVIDNETNREEDMIGLFAPVHLSDLRNQIAVTGGGQGGAVWGTGTMPSGAVADGAALVAERPACVLFGVPTYSTSTSTNPSPNAGADEVSAILIDGGGRGPDDRPGALAIAQRERLWHRFADDIKERGVACVSEWEVAAGERADDYGCGLIYDA